MTSIGTLLAFVIVCIGIMVMRRTRPDLLRPCRTPWVPLVPTLGILTCLAMMVIRLAIYFGYSRHHSYLAGDRMQVGG